MVPPSSQSLLPCIHLWTCSGTPPSRRCRVQMPARLAQGRSAHVSSTPGPSWFSASLQAPPTCSTWLASFSFHFPVQRIQLAGTIYLESTGPPPRGRQMRPPSTTLSISCTSSRPPPRLQFPFPSSEEGTLPCSATRCTRCPVSISQETCLLPTLPTACSSSSPLLLWPSGSWSTRLHSLTSLRSKPAAHSKRDSSSVLHNSQ